VFLMGEVPLEREDEGERERGGEGGWGRSRMLRPGKEVNAEEEVHLLCSGNRDTRVPRL
jgi:hypothetical protein